MLKFFSSLAACGGSLKGSDGSLSHSAGYPDDTDCEWTIEVPNPTASVYLETAHFDLHDDGSCSEYLEIR